jgi:hypothetical protein
MNSEWEDDGACPIHLDENLDEEAQLLLHFREARLPQDACLYVIYDLHNIKAFQGEIISV